MDVDDETAGAEGCGRCSEGTVLTSGLQSGWEPGLDAGQGQGVGCGPREVEGGSVASVFGDSSDRCCPSHCCWTDGPCLPMAPRRVSQLHGDVKESLVHAGKLNFDL